MKITLIVDLASNEQETQLDIVEALAHTLEGYGYEAEVTEARDGNEPRGLVYYGEAVVGGFQITDNEVLA